MSDDGRVKPERDFSSVWSADAQAHSSTLQSRVRGGGVKKRTDEIRDGAGWQRKQLPEKNLKVKKEIEDNRTIVFGLSTLVMQKTRTKTRWLTYG